ncbi:outer membrane protein assembly factor BamD [Massilia sp. W12]|uniref:outer membrane protein assembly factor BamD n=1 Tax=Massilia sp. W12 TaxID=3126507 RepID=UPI0030CCA357
MHKHSKTLVAALLCVSLSACGLFPDRADETKNWTATKLYTEAKEDLTNGNYERAVQLFEKLEARFPFGTYAQQSQMEIAYAHYKQGDQAQALAAIERFIKLHPNHPSVDYMYYLRGLVNFNDKKDFLHAIYDQDPTERDSKATREAFDAFRQLAEKFPASQYTPDAVARMKYLINAMAQYEVHVARYYMRRGAYLAAANRAQTAVRDYNGSPAVEEALWIMAQAYDKMGLNDLRDDALRVFKLNYPKSAYLGNGLQQDKAWWKFW